MNFFNLVHISVGVLRSGELCQSPFGRILTPWIFLSSTYYLPLNEWTGLVCCTSYICVNRLQTSIEFLIRALHSVISTISEWLVKKKYMGEKFLICIGLVRLTLMNFFIYDFFDSQGFRKYTAQIMAFNFEIVVLNKIWYARMSVWKPVWLVLWVMPVIGPSVFSSFHCRHKGGNTFNILTTATHS